MDWRWSNYRNVDQLRYMRHMNGQLSPGFIAHPTQMDHGQGFQTFATQDIRSRQPNGIIRDLPRTQVVPINTDVTGKPTDSHRYDIHNFRPPNVSPANQFHMMSHSSPRSSRHCYQADSPAHITTPPLTYRNCPDSGNTPLVDHLSAMKRTNNAVPVDRVYPVSMISETRHVSTPHPQLGTAIRGDSDISSSSDVPSNIRTTPQSCVSVKREQTCSGAPSGVSNPSLLYRETQRQHSLINNARTRIRHMEEAAERMQKSIASQLSNFGEDRKDERAAFIRTHLAEVKTMKHGRDVENRRVQEALKQLDTLRTIEADEQEKQVIRNKLPVPARFVDQSRTPTYDPMDTPRYHMKPGGNRYANTSTFVENASRNFAASEIKPIYTPSASKPNETSYRTPPSKRTGVVTGIPNVSGSVDGSRAFRTNSTLQGPLIIETQNLGFPATPRGNHRSREYPVVHVNNMLRVCDRTPIPLENGYVHQYTESAMQLTPYTRKRNFEHMKSMSPNDSVRSFHGTPTEMSHHLPSQKNIDYIRGSTENRIVVPEYGYSHVIGRPSKTICPTMVQFCKPPEEIAQELLDRSSLGKYGIGNDGFPPFESEVPSPINGENHITLRGNDALWHALRKHKVKASLCQEVDITSETDIENETSTCSSSDQQVPGTTNFFGGIENGGAFTEVSNLITNMDLIHDISLFLLSNVSADRIARIGCPRLIVPELVLELASQVLTGIRQFRQKITEYLRKIEIDSFDLSRRVRIKERSEDVDGSLQRKNRSNCNSICSTLSDLKDYVIKIKTENCTSYCDKFIKPLRNVLGASEASSAAPELRKLFEWISLVLTAVY